jgi:hypothetical protein
LDLDGSLKPRVSPGDDDDDKEEVVEEEEEEEGKREPFGAPEPSPEKRTNAPPIPTSIRIRGRKMQKPMGIAKTLL